MQKIGVIGLGNIAQKAYLPVMASLQDEYEWHLTTRDPQKGEHLQKQYGFKHLHQTLDQLIAEKPLAVFVHTPTRTHPAIIKQLLEAGINVYVDKPVSDDFDKVVELYQLAEQKHLLLTCGFNRRFAPFNQKLKQISNKKTITVEKTRQDVKQTPKDAIFDLAIHAVDTALFLADTKRIDQVSSKIILDGADLAQYYLTMFANDCQINVITNMHSGINLEQATVQGETERGQVNDLNKYTSYSTGSKTELARPDWESTLTTRGFEPLITQFLQAVSTGKANPVDPTSVILSHRICSDSL